MTSDVRATLATARGVSRLATTMADAFCDDPVLNWLFAPAPDLAGARATFFSLAIPAGRQRGHTYECLVDGNPIAGALWLPPDVHDLFIDPAEMGAFLATGVGGDALDRLGALSELMKAHQPETPSFHLLLLGVAPAAQGKGIGERAMRPVIERCDHDGLPIYLESSNPRNIPFYERLGFVVTSEFAPADGVDLAGMWREPGS